MADAGETLSSAVGHLRGGLEALSFTGNRIPVAALERFHPEVTDALAEVKTAEARADEVATTFVPGAVVEAGDQLRSTLHQSASGLMATDAVTRESCPSSRARIGLVDTSWHRRVRLDTAWYGGRFQL